MRRDYRLHELDSDEFETLVVRICTRWFGNGVTPFALGKDGGRDGKFLGTALCFPSAAAPLTGHVVIQAKHVKSADKSCSDRDFIALLKKEHDKVRRLVELKICDHYVVFTNRKYTASADETLVRDLLTLGLKTATIIGVERLSLAIDDYPDIRDDLPNQKVSNPDLRKLQTTVAEILARVSSGERSLIENTPENALRRQIAYLVGGSPNATIAELADETAAFAARYKQLQEEISALRVSDSESKKLVIEAQTALERGDIGQARRAFAKAIERQQEAIKEPLTELADVYFSYGQASLLDNDWRAASAAFLKCADIASLTDKTHGLAVKLHFANELIRFSECHVDHAPLRQAIALSEEILAASSPAEHGVTFAFKALAAVQRGYVALSRRVPSRVAQDGLRSAIALCRKFLALDCACLPQVERLQFTIDLASALTQYGERDHGRAGSKALIEAAQLLEYVAAKNGGLSKTTESAVHHGRGCALKLLAERSKGPAATKHFRAAVVSFEKAIDMLEAGSEAWCVAKSNLGIVLWAHAGKLDDDQALPMLEKARAFHLAAIDSTDKGLNRPQWAWMKHNLAATRSDIGERLSPNASSLLQDAHADILDAIAIYAEEGNSVQLIEAHLVKAYISAFRAFNTPSSRALSAIRTEESMLRSFLGKIDDDAFFSDNLRDSITELQAIHTTVKQLLEPDCSKDAIDVAKDVLAAVRKDLRSMPPYFKRLMLKWPRRNNENQTIAR
ncbi:MULTISPECIES: hypothetical protein [unclassified Sinorhizobium]|uniref:hypothetical protein n=1 Tax=unclassified Sinorhizobium TaxID=2613772 RepID=UPI003525FE51